MRDPTGCSRVTLWSESASALITDLGAGVSSGSTGGSTKNRSGSFRLRMTVSRMLVPTRLGGMPPLLISLFHLLMSSCVVSTRLLAMRHLGLVTGGRASPNSLPTSVALSPRRDVLCLGSMATAVVRYLRRRVLPHRCWLMHSILAWLLLALTRYCRFSAGRALCAMLISLSRDGRCMKTTHRSIAPPTPLNVARSTLTRRNRQRFPIRTLVLEFRFMPTRSTLALPSADPSLVPGALALWNASLHSGTGCPRSPGCRRLSGGCSPPRRRLYHLVIAWALTSSSSMSAFIACEKPKVAPP